MNQAFRSVILLASVFVLIACSSDSDNGATTDTSSPGIDDGTAAGNTDAGNEMAGESDGAMPDNTGGSPDDSGSQALDATYRVTFNATWSQTSHPVNFPADPHFSGLVGAVHSEQAILWEPGQIATDGIEQMAETGAKGLLLAEVQDIIGEGRGLSEISGGGVGTSPGSVSVEFTVTRDNPQVSLVTMVAPSPDWFVGVHGLSLLDGDGQFVQTVTVDLAVYDSGTDSGLQYASGDQDTQPRQPIALVNSESDDSDLVDGLPVVGQFVFEQI